MPPPLPQYVKSRLNLWPALWPSSSGAKRSWVISCTMCGRPTWPLTLTFDLLTWIPIGIIYSSRTIYLPCLKLLRQNVLELSVAQGISNQHDLWPWTYLPEYQWGSSFYLGLSTYKVWKLVGQNIVELSVAQGKVDQHDLLPWPTDLNINRDHLLILDYLPTKFKLVGQSIIELSVAQGIVDQHYLWPWPLIYWPEYQ